MIAETHLHVKHQRPFKSVPLLSFLKFTFARFENIKSRSLVVSALVANSPLIVGLCSSSSSTLCRSPSAGMASVVLISVAIRHARPGRLEADSGQLKNDSRTTRRGHSRRRTDILYISIIRSLSFSISFPFEHVSETHRGIEPLFRHSLYFTVLCFSLPRLATKM